MFSTCAEHLRGEGGGLVRSEPGSWGSGGPAVSPALPCLGLIQAPGGILLLEKNRSLQSENAALRISNSDLSGRLTGSRVRLAPPGVEEEEDEP